MTELWSWYLAPLIAYTRQYDRVGEVARDQIARQVVLLTDQAAARIEHVRSFGSIFSRFTNI